MKLRNRINLYTAVMFISLFILLNGAVYYTFSHVMLESELQDTTDEARQTVEGISRTDASVPANTLLRAYMPVSGMLQIVKQNGQAAAAVTAPSQGHLSEYPAVFYEKERHEIVEYEGVRYAFVSIPVVWEGGELASLQMTESLERAEEALAVLRAVLVVVTVIAMVPVILSSRWLSNFITQPISSMIRTMGEIQRSGQHKKIELPKKSKDELYQMADTFNHMMNLLQRNYEKQGQFISNASHELKTPLTVIESYASLLKRRGKEQPELFDESVEAIHSEAVRMKNLTEQLLQLARQEEQWNVELADVHLTPLVEKSVQAFQKAYNRGVTLQVKEDVILRTDQQKLSQLLYILMDNARKYSEASIQVVIRLQENWAVVEIIDQGIGIPADELASIFDRFYRVDKARTRKTGGFGLGLSLAKEIAEAMGADVRLESKEGEGTTAQIWLPLTDSH